MAVNNNRSLRIARMNPAIKRTFEEQNRAAFDPAFRAEISGDWRRYSRLDSDGGLIGGLRNTTVSGSVGVSGKLPTGTEVGLFAGGSESDDSPGDARLGQSDAGLTVSQSLLQGLGAAPNLVELRQARLDTRLSEHELRAFAESLVAEVENTFWDYRLARRSTEIVRESMRLAERQLEDVRRRIAAGGLAETELAAAMAEVALRREALINADSLLASLRIRFLRLVRPAALKEPSREILPRERPAAPGAAADSLSEHVAVALKQRPDLAQAALLLQRDELELVKTRNGMLPRMDLFVSLGKTGYAESFSSSVEKLGRDTGETTVGLVFSTPIGNREAGARHARALFSREQRRESILNMEDLVRVDVASAHIEVGRSSQQVEATAATQRFQEEKLRAETAKFDVGHSTALLVAQAQRDLLVSQVAAEQAAAAQMKAMTKLFLMDGSLLDRRGISVSATEPGGSDGNRGGSR